MLASILGWVVTVLLLLLPLVAVYFVLRASRRFLAPVFAHDARLLSMRLVYGLANLLLIVPIGFLFFQHDLNPPWLVIYPLILVLACFFAWLALWLLALVQLFGMMFGVPHEHLPAHVARH
jgi:hypothetical protein